MGKLGKDTGMTADESHTQKRSDRWNEGRKVHFASLMDLCHLKNSQLGPKFQKYKDRVELRGDIVKDDSGSYAVLQQGSPVSEKTAAKVMDVISRLPGWSGQAAASYAVLT